MNLKDIETAALELLKRLVCFKFHYSLATFFFPVNHFCLSFGQPFCFYGQPLFFWSTTFSFDNFFGLIIFFFFYGQPLVVLLCSAINIRSCHTFLITSSCVVHVDIEWSHLAISNIYVNPNHNCVRKTNPPPYHYPYTNHRYLIDEMADKVPPCTCYIQRNKARFVCEGLRYATMFPFSSRKKKRLTGTERCTIVLQYLLFYFLHTSNTTQYISNTNVPSLLLMIYLQGWRLITTDVEKTPQMHNVHPTLSWLVLFRSFY
jgi:hypothetical protein